MRFALLAFSLVLSATPALALDVSAVRFGTHPDKQRIVIELSDKAVFKAFPMENPNRMIVDLPGFSWKVSNIQKPVSSLISDIRHGDIGSGQSRIVMETSAPAQIISSFLLPKDKTSPYRIVIDFQKASSPISNAGAEKPDIIQTATKHSANSTQNLNDQLPASLKKPAFEPAVTLRAPKKGPEPAHGHADKLKRAVSITKYEPDIQPETVAVQQAANDVAPSYGEEPKFKSNQKPLIILDPGHGGQDPGARAANGNYEKTIVLAVALELKKLLEDSGQYRVQMTRDTDIFIPLRDRVKFARRNGGDLFISLHADSMQNVTVSGASVYTLSNTASDKEAEKLAERENKSDAIAGVNLSNQDNDVANILIDLASRDTMNQSRYLANTVVSTMPTKGVEMLARKPHRSAGFAVLKAMDIPSILVEMGYLTNMNEANRLSTKEYRLSVARGLKASVDAYFTKVAKLSD